MASFNEVTLIGNLGRDPEVRETNGGKVVNLSVATTEKWKDKSGEIQSKTEWHRVVIWNERLADVAEKYLSKGSLVMVRGQLQTRKWTDNTGAERYATETVLQKFRGELVLLGGGGGGERQASSGSRPAPRHDDLSDEIPF